MDPATIAIILMIIGLVFLIVEALTPGFFAVIPGAILVVVGVFGYFIDGFFDSMLYMGVTVFVVALVVTFITIKGYQILARPEPPTTTVVDSLIGKEGVVIADVKPGNLKGKVRIDTDSWSATSDTVIKTGSEVIVYAAEGVHVKVRPKDL
ncbi:MAG: NfeD family protein [Methanomassiliicoccaceae archaeon]|nr:NfeD family protein [Methanomassiliicoccaceae archaeon]